MRLCVKCYRFGCGMILKANALIDNKRYSLLKVFFVLIEISQLYTGAKGNISKLYTINIIMYIQFEWYEGINML